MPTSEAQTIPTSRQPSSGPFADAKRRLDYLFASDLLAGQALQAAFRMETAFNREREKGPRNG
jgi:hypothetical protein